ncbi:MAG: potassium channel family protein [Methanosarcinaceae archaeon]
MKTGHLIVLGYGDVGKRIVEVLEESNAHFTVVDQDEEILTRASFDIFNKNNFNVVIGNSTHEEVLMEAGIEDADAVIIGLNNDSDTIFSTLIARSLNPKSTIFARANSVDSIDKIYKAGADYVASLSIVAGEMLAKIISICDRKDPDCTREDIVLYEGIEIEKYHVPTGSDVIGSTVKQMGFVNSMNCKVIGIEREGEIRTGDLDQMVIKENDTIAVVGSMENIDIFKRRYITHHNHII